MSGADELRWVRQWQEAGVALQEEKRRELRALTPERALFLSDAVLSLRQPDTPRARGPAWSGLVEQQALFGRARVR
jgi:hypothetical protein